MNEIQRNDSRPSNVVRTVDDVFLHRFVLGHLRFHVRPLDERHKRLDALGPQFGVQLFKELWPFCHSLLVVSLPHGVVELGILWDRSGDEISFQLQNRAMS